MASHCTVQNVAQRLENAILTQRRGMQEQALSFLTCEERGKVDQSIGKAPQLLDAEIRHMHRKQSAYSNPTGAACSIRLTYRSLMFCPVQSKGIEPPNPQRTQR